MSIIALLISVSLLGTSLVGCADEYVYYGVVPARIYYYMPAHVLHGAADLTAGWIIEERTIRSSGILAIVAYTDNTNVKVFNLKDGSVISSTPLNRMQKHYDLLPNASMVKVVSDHRVSVMLLCGIIGDGLPNATTIEGPGENTFLTSTDGTYVGKEYIFIASQGLINMPYSIIALEDAQITIYKDDGSTETSFTLKANEFKVFRLSAFKAYRVTSTGNIMLEEGCPGERSFYVPSTQGGFVGTVFYVRTSEGQRGDKYLYDPIEEHGFTIMALEDAKVTMWDVEYKKPEAEWNIKAGDSVSMIRPAAREIMIESDKPITVAFLHNGGIRTANGYLLGSGITCMGIRPNEDTMVHLPTNSSNQAYIFAYEDTTVNVDDVPITIKRDQYFIMTMPGDHKIRSDKNVVLQLIHRPLIPPEQGIGYFGFEVSCIQDVNLTPTVTLTPLTSEGGFPTTYIIIGAVAAVAVAVAGFIAMKRRSKK